MCLSLFLVFLLVFPVLVLSQLPPPFSYQTHHSPICQFSGPQTPQNMMIDCIDGEGCSLQPRDCICPQGYKGSFCQDMTIFCPPNRCLNGGTCINYGQHDQCLCTSNFQGVSCEHPLYQWKPVQLPFYCQNGGTCQYSPQLHVYRCLCPPGCAGKFCEQRLPFPYMDSMNDREEQRDAGYFVPVPLVQPSTSTSTSPSTSTSSFRTSTFTVNAGIRVVRSPCSPNPCMHGGTCNLIMPKRMRRQSDGDGDWVRYQCDCMPCTTGDRCQHVVDPCKKFKCENDGECAVDVNCTPYCDCKGSGFVGFKCQFIQQCDPCQINPCQNGGICHILSGSFSCQCSPGYSGRLCEQKANPCATITSCVDPLRQCVVKDNVPICSRRNENPCILAGFDCSPNAHCASSDKSQPECVCPENYGGDGCDIALNPCNANPCMFDGRCERNGMTDFECSCPPHQSGRYCEQCDPCFPNPCLHGGRCFADPYGINFTCQCVPDWHGIICSYRGNPCMNYPCFHGTSCILNNMTGQPQCLCPKSLIGPYCEHQNLCQQMSPCVKVGSRGCRMIDDGAFICDCKANYIGHTCAFSTAVIAINDFCQIYKPCLAGGICQKDETGLNYSCICPKHTWGVDCQLNMCSLDKFPCVHGYCTFESDGKAVCDCSLTPFEGRFCQKFSGSKCRSFICHNQGTCFLSNSTVDSEQLYCVCDSGWTGKWCDWNIQWTTTLSALNDTSISSTPRVVCDQVNCGHGFKCISLSGGRFKCLRDYTVTLAPLPKPTDSLTHPCIDVARCEKYEECVLYKDGSYGCLLKKPEIVVVTRIEFRYVNLTTTQSTTLPSYNITSAQNSTYIGVVETVDWLNTWWFSLLVALGVLLLLITLIVCFVCWGKQLWQGKREKKQPIDTESETAVEFHRVPMEEKTQPTAGSVSPSSTASSSVYLPVHGPTPPVVIEYTEEIEYSTSPSSSASSLGETPIKRLAFTRRKPTEQNQSPETGESVPDRRMEQPAGYGESPPVLYKIYHSHAARILLLATADGSPISPEESNIEPPVCLTRRKSERVQPAKPADKSPIEETGTMKGTQTSEPPPSPASPSPSPIIEDEMRTSPSPIVSEYEKPIISERSPKFVQRTSPVEKTQICPPPAVLPSSIGTVLETSLERTPTIAQQTQMTSIKESEIQLKPEKTQIAPPPPVLLSSERSVKEISPETALEKESEVQMIPDVEAEVTKEVEKTQRSETEDEQNVECDSHTMAMALLMATSDGRGHAMRSAKYTTDITKPKTRLILKRKEAGGSDLELNPSYMNNWLFGIRTSTLTNDIPSVSTTCWNTTEHSTKPRSHSAIVPGSDC